MKLTDKEINTILSKSQDVRYSYSLKRIADNDCLWILTTKAGHFISIQEEGQSMLPIWPFQEYAENYISALSKDDDYMTITLIPQHYSLTLFISTWATKSCPGFCHVRNFTYLSVA